MAELLECLLRSLAIGIAVAAIPGSSDWICAWYFSSIADGF
jgi:hypothetical protein